MLCIRPLLWFTAHFWVKLGFAQSYGNITYGQTLTYGNNTYAETYLTPTAQGTTWYWSQAITPAILGTVFVVINDHNQTQTITSTNSAAVANNTQYLKNGTLSLLTRTDVNELGTVTDVVPTGGGREVVVAYPTPYFTVVSPVSWQGLFPDLQFGVTCCNPLKATASPVPQNHYSFPSLTGSTNSADPRGWLYLMATSYPETYSGSQNLSSLLAPATLSSVRQHCPHFMCAAASSALGAEGVQMAGALLETSTVHVTGTFSTSASPAATAKPTKETSLASVKSSVKIDPVPATRPSATVKTSRPAATAVQQVSNIVEVTNTPAQPTSKTSAENIGIALGHLLDTTIPPGIDTTTASKDGATDVSAATGLLSIDSDLNVIHPTTLTTQPASKVFESQPDSALPRETDNIRDTIGSLLGSDASSDKANVQPSVETEPPEVGIGSKSVALQPTHLATTISGVSTNVPAVIIGSQTVAIGSSSSMGSIPVAVITAGSKTAVVVNGDTTHFLPQATAARKDPLQPTLVIGSSSVTANSDSQYIIAGQTLAAGSSITVGSGSSATVIQLQTSGSEAILVVGSSSSVLQQQTTAILTVGPAKITPIADSQYLLDLQTLVPGASAITVSGVQYSLAPDGGELVAGSSTRVLTSDDGIGGYIWSALGGASEESSSSKSWQASTTTDSGTSTTSGGTSQASTTESQAAGAADAPRPLCLCLLVALIFGIGYGV